MKNNSKVLCVGVLAVLALGFFASSAFAQAQPAPSSGGGTSFFDVYVKGGGVIGWIIILLSISSIALIIEHFVTIQRDKLVPPEIVVQLEEMIEQEQYEEALNICDATKNYVTSVVGAALARIQDGWEAMSVAAESAAEEENLKLTHKVGWLSLIGNVAPMMGLFGTVVGMVVAFTEIANSTEQPSPQQLAGGIYTALVTTVWGLIVAIPALSFYFVFKNKVQRLAFELSAVSGELIERLKPVAGTQIGGGAK
jgi:biopolymer transport protein ExbB